MMHQIAQNALAAMMLLATLFTGVMGYVLHEHRGMYQRVQARANDRFFFLHEEIIRRDGSLQLRIRDVGQTVIALRTQCSPAAVVPFRRPPRLAQASLEAEL